MEDFIKAERLEFVFKFLFNFSAMNGGACDFGEACIRKNGFCYWQKGEASIM